MVLAEKIKYVIPCVGCDSNLYFEKDDMIQDLDEDDECCEWYIRCPNCNTRVCCKLSIGFDLLRTYYKVAK